jgi:hypothetical protein
MVEVPGDAHTITCTRLTLRDGKHLFLRTKWFSTSFFITALDFPRSWSYNGMCLFCFRIARLHFLSFTYAELGRFLLFPSSLRGLNETFVLFLACKCSSNWKPEISWLQASYLVTCACARAFGRDWSVRCGIGNEKAVTKQEIERRASMWGVSGEEFLSHSRLYLSEYGISESKCPRLFPKVATSL